MASPFPWPASGQVNPFVAAGIVDYSPKWPMGTDGGRLWSPRSWATSPDPTPAGRGGAGSAAGGDRSRPPQPYNIAHDGLYRFKRVDVYGVHLDGGPNRYKSDLTLQDELARWHAAQAAAASARGYDAPDAYPRPHLGESSLERVLGRSHPSLRGPLTLGRYGGRPAPKAGDATIRAPMQRRLGGTGRTQLAPANWEQIPLSAAATRGDAVASATGPALH